jgi:putative ABC transport system permease protein
MIKNYLKIAWRNLVKNKTHSFINIAGLSVGMAVAMLIGLWIWDEVSYDKYHQNYESIGQIMTTQTSNGQSVTFGSTVVPLSNELRTKYGNSFKLTALASEGTHILAAGETKISQQGLWAEPHLPALLSLVMVKGNYNTFNDPMSVLLSASSANALFGNDDPINKVVRIDNYKDMKVTGVYQDLPHNTTLNQTMVLLPWSSPANFWSKQPATWDNHGCQLYVQLNPNADFNKVSAQVRNITTPYNKAIDETIQVFPMSRWHLYNDFQNGKSVGGRIQFIRLFGIIGLFVLLLACINFMNLSTARSEKRAKEVGIRKAIGSLRGQLIGQFLSESMLVVFLALILTLALVWLAIPYFNNIADKQVAMPLGNPLFWLFIISFTFFTGLVSGSYPAFYLSGFKPIKVLKGKFSVGRLASLPRKILVVVQFTVSIVLIIGTVVVFRQIQFASNRPIGYTREGLITVEMNTPQIYGHYEAMRNDLIQTGAVLNMAESSNATTQIFAYNTGFDWEGKAPGFNPSFANVFVSTDFGKTIGWKIIDGRDFSRNYPTDSGAFILNESAVKLSGIKNPVGKIMHWFNKDHVITGVVKDMIMESPYQQTVATVFQMKPDWVKYITVRINPNTPMHEALSKIEPVFKKYNPGSPFEYKFNDDEYAKKFSDEQRIGRLASVFAVFAIFISCLGLFGMASFIAEQRIKEIGVRKVLGATVFNLWSLLSKDFIVLVVISLLIATPVAYYFMHSWLQNYQYRTGIAWWIFAITALGAVTITLATVSYQSIKAALTNPVKSLKTE